MRHSKKRQCLLLPVSIVSVTLHLDVIIYSFVPVLILAHFSFESSAVAAHAISAATAPDSAMVVAAAPDYYYWYCYKEHNASPETSFWSSSSPHSNAYPAELPVAIDGIVHHCSSGSIHRWWDDFD